MRELSAKTRLIAAITAIAVALVCVFAAVFYTRAGLETPAGDPEQGEVAAAQPLDYGDATGGIPSGAVAIGDQTAFYAFINGTASYGYLTADITLSTWLYSDLVLGESRTLDGNGHTVTIVNDRSSLDSVYESQWTGTHIVTGSSEYLQWWGNYGSDRTYTLHNGKSIYALSDIVSANYGTIKNMKVVMNGNSEERRDHIVASQFDGNVSMGVIAGYNAGTISNCTVTVNDKYGLLPSPFAVVGQSNIQKVSYQYMTAVGGVAGYNTGNILGTKVTLNSDIGIFRSALQLRTGSLSGYGTVYNLPIDSGSVGGVAGINDGGSLVGLTSTAANAGCTTIYGTTRRVTRGLSSDWRISPLRGRRTTSTVRGRTGS